MRLSTDSSPVDNPTTKDGSINKEARPLTSNGTHLFALLTSSVHGSPLLRKPSKILTGYLGHYPAEEVDGETIEVKGLALVVASKKPER